MSSEMASDLEVVIGGRVEAARAVKIDQFVAFTGTKP